MLAEAWEKACKLRNEFNARVYTTDEKVQELVRRYKEFEDNIKDVNDKDFFVTDLLDPKVSDLLIAVEDGTYERPAEKTVYDFLHSDTMFETIIGEILLRNRAAAPAPNLEN